MGAWGTDPFDNDDASDWSYQLFDGGGVEVVESALAAAVTQSPQEAPEASATVAAAALVALACGIDVPVNEEVRAWLANADTTALRDLRPAAAGALSQVLADSELAELWDEVGESWHQQTEQLRDQLAGER